MHVIFFFERQILSAMKDIKIHVYVMFWYETVPFWFLFVVIITSTPNMSAAASATSLIFQEAPDGILVIQKDQSIFKLLKDFQF